MTGRQARPRNKMTGTGRLGRVWACDGQARPIKLRPVSCPDERYVQIFKTGNYANFRYLQTPVKSQKSQHC